MKRQGLRLSMLVLCLFVLNTFTTALAQTDAYIDNRSTPEALITSYVNAINRKEYVRAYSYWDIAGGKPAQLAPFPEFQQGYANTQSVRLTIGTIGGGVAAGNLYYSVPITLVAQTTSGTIQTFVGCYTLHQVQPAIQGVPPFRPMGIQSAQIQQIPNNANIAIQMARACADQDVSTAALDTPTPVNDPTAIDATRYIDDRSGPVEVLRSLFNAVNRKEYVRAYSYWDTTGGTVSQPAPFPEFQQGYANTQSVQLFTGTVSSDAGAGQVYYNVPTTLIARTVEGLTQTFVGCYQLHLAQPAIQGTLPFRPLGIISARVQQYPNNANTAQLMQQVCSF